MSLAKPWILAVVLASLIVGPAMPLGAWETADTPIAPGGPDLKTTLEKGLRTRRPVEFAFVSSVVHQVDEGTLPRSLVESTFLWASRKRPYPFPYFERALKERAKKLGYTVQTPSS